MNRISLILICTVTACFIGADTVFSASIGDMLGGGKKAKKDMAEMGKQIQACQAMIAQKDQEYQRLIDGNKDSQDIIQGLRDKNSTLMEAYEKIVSDQDNVMEQLNRLRREKQRCDQITESFDEMTLENEAYTLENKTLEEDKEGLKLTLESLKSHIGELTEENEQLNFLLEEANEEDAVKIQKVKDKMKNDFEKLKRINRSLEDENDTLAKLFKDTEKRSKLLDKRNTEYQQEIEVFQIEVSELEKENAGLKDENRYLAQQASEFPKRFTDLARHNRKLVKETAHMHYNMGVSFIKGKEYKRAVKEFKKVLEIKPDDAYAHYNLGYIYAEHLVDRPAAIKYFKDYLTYAKDAKDADWVKKYILTWQTWYGKEKFK